MISVIIPSVRDYRWKDIVKEFSVTKADYEIIVVGPCPPQDLGANFRVIQTNVKAAQCVEIGVRQSKGEYLFFSSDDVIEDPNMLDVFLSYILQYRASARTWVVHKDDLVILTPTVKQLGRFMQFGDELFPCTRNPDIETPLIPGTIFISRKDWDRIGGVDRNFVSVYWNADVAMRCWAMGGKVITFPNVFSDEIIPNISEIGSANSGASFYQDWPYLLRLWTDGSAGSVTGILRKTRSRPFEPFIDEGIMETDQGTPDRHKKTCQNFSLALSEYIRTGRSPGCHNLEPMD